VNITDSAKCYTSRVLFAWWTDLKNGVPSQEPEKDFVPVRDGDGFHDDG
jgi:hypothetical protein